MFVFLSLFVPCWSRLGLLTTTTTTQEELFLAFAHCSIHPTSKTGLDRIISAFCYIPGLHFLLNFLFFFTIYLVPLFANKQGWDCDGYHE